MKQYPKFKTIYRLITFYRLDIPEHNDVQLRFHGILDFSSLEKLKEMCPWADTDSIICTITAEENYDDLDYVPNDY